MTDRVPDVIGEIVAFRAWHVERSLRRGIQLASLGSLLPTSRVWPRDNWMTAQCPTKCCSEEIPGERCTCGIYAARSRAKLLSQWHYSTMEGVVIGEVGLAGRIIPGEKAYRAARARPLHLYVPHSKWKLIQPLQDAYRIPVELTNPFLEGERHGHRPAV